jgi:uncharacterized protein (TIGR03067 family)
VYPWDQPRPNKMKTTTTLLSLTVIALCGFAASPAVAGDQENIQGTWTLEKVSMNGKAMPVPVVTYLFAGDALTIHPQAGAEQKATFKLEATSKPKVLVVQHSESASGAKSDRSPYELSGDTLKIAFSSPGEHSPEVSDSGQILFTLQRKKS